jgi:hypothetical protein
MINKNSLESVIQKYYLNGLNNQVKWRIKDNTLTVYAGVKGRACKVFLDDFNFADCELGIFDTHKLSKLLSITSGELMITTEKNNQLHRKLYLADNNYSLDYSLADPLIMGKVTWYEDADENIDVELDVSSDDISYLIKAKNALNDVDQMLIQTTEDLDGSPIVEFLFGDKEGFSNKITYQIQGEIKDKDIQMPFDSNVFKDILSSNKDMDSCNIKLYKKGMMKIEFHGELSNKKSSSIYYIDRNE